ncbi:hypothetical protein [Rhodococcus qingshengii]|uniref:hypothetical protein n=1 Tax=Rhodococcus qingshengii TaxID=334542 RepID=UPI001C5D6083|nr:hypothetical protein [Rhodococcus qingshengii]MBW4818430.1 hypothetical protein [Rhodococcus qingshengii]
MALQPDDPWTHFRAAIREIAPKKLSDYLEAPGIDHFTTSNWKQGKARPPLDLLPKISEALGKDPTFLAQQMGIVPNAEQSLDHIVRVQKRLMDLETSLDKLDRYVANRRDKAIGKIVAEAARTDRWAVAVWPAREGPDGFEFHVSDRLDFTRVDGEAVTHAALQQEKRLSELLAQAHAVNSPDVRPRWSRPTGDDTESEGKGPHVLRLSVPRLTSTFSPGTATPIRKQGSVAVVALTVNSWAMDTAGFLARILNYGFMSSRAIATESTGYRVHRSAAQSKLRSDAHATMLAHPEPRYVWGHVGRQNPVDFFPDPRDWPSTLTCVWVRESDDLFTNTITEANRAKYLEARDAMDAYVKALESKTNRIIQVEANYPKDTNGAPLARSESRNPRMAEAFENAVLVVEQMIRRKFVDQQTIESTVASMSESNEDRSSIAHTMHRWLAAEGRLGAVDRSVYSSSSHSSSSRMGEE